MQDVTEPVNDPTELSESSASKLIATSRQQTSGKANASTSRLKPQPRARYSFEHRILLNLLIEARKASGLSQKALSSRLGKSLSHISFIESNDRDITFVEVARICEIVGLPLTELAQVFSQQVSEERVISGTQDSHSINQS